MNLFSVNAFQWNFKCFLFTKIYQLSISKLEKFKNDFWRNSYKNLKLLC